MKISRIEINNYRLLSNFSVDLEKKLSLVIGKNNTGKTSFLSLLEKFLRTSKNTFSFEDFNLDFQKEIEKIANSKIEKDKFPNIDIGLKIYIEYFDEDSLENISKLILNLDPKDNYLIMRFSYGIDYENFEKLKRDFTKFKEKIVDKDLIYFLKKNHRLYFKITKRVLESNNESNFIDIEDADIKKIINFQTIGAKRDVANEDGDGKKSNKTLSRLSSKYFDSINNPNQTDITDLQKQLLETDKQLDNTYKILFNTLLENVKTFASKESLVQIKSTLEEINILKENTSVVYNQNGQVLPEDYNGLGYMNLFAIIFNIHIKLDEFKKEYSKSEKPADINLLFIEEPEAHTHPQMQYVFIKNIKNMLDTETKGKINLQTIVSTHSSHIVSQSDFNDIKYFYKDEQSNNVISKNLSDLENLYSLKAKKILSANVEVSNDKKKEVDTDDKSDVKLEKVEENLIDAVQKKNFQFIKQYLTLNKSELFFADKVVFIEGDTERILLPVIMLKIDLENISTPDYVPLLSQNISIVEVGAFSHLFDNFLNFLGIKTLIITDLDSVKTVQQTNDLGEVKMNKDGVAKTSNQSCPVSEGTETSNASIKHYLKGKTFEQLKTLSSEDKQLNKNFDNWVKDPIGKLRIAFQTSQNNYHARSFEDAFISINLEFLKDHKDQFTSLKNISKLSATPVNYYDIANNCIDKKTSFATEILYYSNETYSDWAIPEYIKEGLIWLAQ